MANQEPQDNSKNNLSNPANAGGVQNPGLGNSPSAANSVSSNGNGNGNGNRANATAVVKEAVAYDEFESVIIRGEAEKVKLDNIEKGLTNLWQAAAKMGNAESGSPVMRACVLNLVIFVESNALLAPITDIITKLTWSYPCRALVLVSEPESPENDMQAWISTHCQQPDSSGKKVCCEQITVHGLGQSSEFLSSMVLPLLVADLPVVMWWPGNPPMSGTTFDHLLENSDRFISDSAHFSESLDGLSRLAQLMEFNNERVVVSDFNWARLTPWRGLVAQFFDEPSLIPYLFSIDKIEVEFVVPENAPEPNLAMSLLLVGWLACKLGWQPAFGIRQRGKNASLILNQNGQPLNVELVGHSEPHTDAGGISSVKITSSLEDKEAIFAVSLAADSGLAYVMIEENNMPSTRQVTLPTRDAAALLTEELREANHDETYEQCLLMVASIVNLGSGKVGKS